AAIAVTRDGSSVFIAGTEIPAGTGDHPFVVRLAASSGQQRWLATSTSPQLDVTAMALEPDGSGVFVAGADILDPGYGAVAVSGAGKRKWAVATPGFGAGYTADVALSRTGGTVYVAGIASESVRA